VNAIAVAKRDQTLNMKTFCLLVIYNSEREEKTTKENIVKNNVMLIEAPFLIWENYVKSRIKEIHYQVS